MAPFYSFWLVAGADDNIDDEEFQCFWEQLNRASDFSDELHRELAVDIVGNYDEVRKNWEGLDDLPGVVESIRKMLKEKLSVEQYQRFIASLFLSGVRIARASGESPGEMDDKVSREERVALISFAAAFDLDAGSIAGHLT